MKTLLLRAAERLLWLVLLMLLPSNHSNRNRHRFYKPFLSSIQRVINRDCLPAGAFCILLSVSVASCKPPRNIPSVSHNFHRSQTIHEVELELTAPPNVSIGSPVAVKMIVTNRGNHDIRGTYFNGESEINMRLVDSKGQLPGETERRLVRNFGKAESYGGSSGTYLIKPTETKEWTLDLSKYFIFSKGEYSVSVAPVFRVEADQVHFKEAVYFEVTQDK